MQPDSASSDSHSVAAERASSLQAMLRRRPSAPPLPAGPTAGANHFGEPPVVTVSFAEKPGVPETPGASGRDRPHRLYLVGLVLVAMLAAIAIVRSYGVRGTGDDTASGMQVTGTGAAVPPDGPAPPSLTDPSPVPASAPASPVASVSPRGTRRPTAKTHPPGTPTAAVPGRLDGAGPLYGLNGQCLDNNSSVTDNGNSIQIWVCNQTSAQVWTVADGQFRVQDKCLTVSGTAGVLWDCDGWPAQRWQAAADGTVRNPATGRCLTAPDTFTKVTVSACTGATNQTWHR